MTIPLQSFLFFAGSFFFVVFYISSNQIIIRATTITIKDETNKVLATLKGSKDCDSFLKELARNQKL
ncbi:hypothetical protein C5S31_03100 [ANME-1 cluster archaeon GoMg2]|nr:hypothetical protein [ANME-1 cluster archaeon GoMg2]